MTLLSEYLNSHIPSTMRKVDVVEKLHGVIDRATVYKYFAGTHPANPPESVLQAFANVLPGASIVELRTAVNAPAGVETPWVPAAEANRLSPAQRQALDDFIRATVIAMGQGIEAATASTASALSTGTTPLAGADAAAVRRHAEGLRRLGREDFAEAILKGIEPEQESDSDSASPKSDRSEPRRQR